MVSKIDLLAAACNAFGRHGLTVRSERCLRTRHRASGCRTCSTVCPTGAISFRDDLILSADLCNGCGTCAAACQADALAATKPSDTELRSQAAAHARHSGAVAFACETYLDSRAKDRAKVVAVPCIARVSETVLVDAVVAGATRVILVDAACASCPQAALRGIAEAVAKRVGDILSAFVRRTTIELESDLAAVKPLAESAPTGAGLSRRGFFAVLRPATKSEPAPPAPAAQATEPGCAGPPIGFDGRPKEAPERRRRLLEDLRSLGPAKEGARFDDPQWGSATVSATCNGCGICADVCPTAALTTQTQDGGWCLSFTAANCIRCGLCVDVCFLKAMRIDDGIAIDAVLASTPQVLAVKGNSEVDDSTMPLDERFSRMFGCQVTS